MKVREPPDFSHWRKDKVVDLYAVPQGASARECKIVGITRGKVNARIQKTSKSLEDYRFGYLVKRTDPSGKGGSEAIYIFGIYVIAFWGVAGDEDAWLCGILQEDGSWRMLESGKDYQFEFYFNEKELKLFSVGIEIDDEILRIIQKPSSA